MEQDIRTPRDAAEDSKSKEGKYLTFCLAEEEYGLSIEKVREIIGMMTITSVPQTPDFIKGVINLRGKVIPVVNLRLKFEMPEIEYTDRTCIIVAEIEGSRGKIQMGIVVDAVAEVANIKGEDIEKAPAFGGHMQTSFIQGLAKIGGRVKILIDIDLILAGEEIAQIEQAA